MNKINLFGRLTRDPESHTTTSGKNVTRFTLAVERYAVCCMGQAWRCNR